MRAAAPREPGERQQDCSEPGQPAHRQQLQNEIVRVGVDVVKARATQIERAERPGELVEARAQHRLAQKNLPGLLPHQTAWSPGFSQGLQARRLRAEEHGQAHQQGSAQAPAPGQVSAQEPQGHQQVQHAAARTRQQQRRQQQGCQGQRSAQAQQARLP